MEQVLFPCYACQSKVLAQAKYVGRKTRCPKCGAILIIPEDAPIYKPKKKSDPEMIKEINKLSDSYMDIHPGVPDDWVETAAQERSFTYEGKDPDWRDVDGEIMATSVDDAIKRLKEKGIKAEKIDGKNPYKDKWNDVPDIPPEHEEEGVIDSVVNSFKSLFGKGSSAEE